MSIFYDDNHNTTDTSKLHLANVLSFWFRYEQKRSQLGTGKYRAFAVETTFKTGEYVITSFSCLFRVMLESCCSEIKKKIDTDIG